MIELTYIDDHEELGQVVEGAPIKRYFKTYPNHNRKDYAYYLLAICYYDQIVDEQKDLGPIIDAKKNI